METMRTRLRAVVGGLIAVAGAAVLIGAGIDFAILTFQSNIDPNPYDAAPSMLRQIAPLLVVGGGGLVLGLVLLMSASRKQ